MGTDVKKYQGVGIGEAIAFGRLRLFHRPDRHVNYIHIADAESEAARFRQAKTLALRQLDELCERTLRDAGEESAAIFTAHQLMLEDAVYNDSIHSIIRDQLVNRKIGRAHV